MAFDQYARPTNEHLKFVETVDGKVAVRVVGSSGSTSIDVNSNTADMSGYVGKASGDNADFTTAYASATTITLSGLPDDVTAINADDIVSVDAFATDGSLRRRWTRDDAIFTASGTDPTTLTVTGASFVATDTYVVYTNIARPSSGKSYDSATGSDKMFEINPLSGQYTALDLVDTTNESAATHYYPSSTGYAMGIHKDLSLSGKIIDADGSVTISIEVTNDEDTASADWIQVYGYDDKNKADINSWTVTNSTLTFGISFNEMNYLHVRVKVVCSGATNTIIVKGKVKAL